MARSAQQPQAPPSDSVVRKIQLLLNLAARPGTEEEGAAAMNRAQELLARYNLDLATVQDKVVAGGTAEREASQKRDYVGVNRSAMYTWQRKLVRAVAEANFCVYWTEEREEQLPISKKKRKWHEDQDSPTVARQVKRHKILGRTVNTIAVMVMVDYLLDTIERTLPFSQNERLSRNANLWREGCADRLCERIKAKAEVMRTADYTTQGEAAYSTAIQVADLARKEAAANYDHQHGTGAWAKKQAREAEIEVYYWSAEAVATRAKEREAVAAARRDALLASETSEQRKRREAREAKEAEAESRRQRRYNERYWAREDRRQEREEARVNSAAYKAGRVKGEEIGLNDQVGSGQQQGRLG